jgi:hypothetical protein
VSECSNVQFTPTHQAKHQHSKDLDGKGQIGSPECLDDVIRRMAEA